MFRQRARVAGVAEFAEQPRRAFDIGEEEGDGAGRKITPPIVSEDNPCPKPIPQSHRRGAVDTGANAWGP